MSIKYLPAVTRKYYVHSQPLSIVIKQWVNKIDSQSENKTPLRSPNEPQEDENQTT